MHIEKSIAPYAHEHGKGRWRRRLRGPVEDVDRYALEGRRYIGIQYHKSKQPSGRDENSCVLKPLKMKSRRFSVALL